MADYSKLDHFTLKAQKEGYPARSVFKLKEMDAKFGLLKNHQRPFKVLDLGAAPGSWSLYVLRNLSGVGGFSLTSVDLGPLSRLYDQGLFDSQHFTFIQGDFTLPEIREEILSLGPYNLVISDAAPATTGNRSLDTLRSLDLGETALDYAGAALAQGGNLVIKVFQGGDTVSLLKKIQKSFKAGKAFKPISCRADSFETYYLGLGLLSVPGD